MMKDGIRSPLLQCLVSLLTPLQPLYSLGMHLLRKLLISLLLRLCFPLCLQGCYPYLYTFLLVSFHVLSLG